MAKTKKDKTITEIEDNSNWLWFLILLPLLFGFDNKPDKTINIYMGDEKNV